MIYTIIFILVFLQIDGLPMGTNCAISSTITVDDILTVNSCKIDVCLGICVK